MPQRLQCAYGESLPLAMPTRSERQQAAIIALGQQITTLWHPGPIPDLLPSTARLWAIYGTLRAASPRWLSCTQIATATGTSPHTVLRYLTVLRTAWDLETARGRDGGWRIGNKKDAF